ncbi:hypothetical protein [uncultured Pseudoflavonifractor sp.]|uniref:hypothetical protein n=1 Tax=uncultured Pseudoflavonifractor sp. TaxID=1221379 RepID=UPI0025F38273|nr:hypothetical protein [uncultured Pseudoflavonifractor sp.]
MRRIKCDNCGKVYDGDARDFCPSCGRRTPRGDAGGNTGHFQFSAPPPEPDEPVTEPVMAPPVRRGGGVLLLRVLIGIGLAVCAALIAWGVVRYQTQDSGPIPSVAEDRDTFAVGGLTVAVNGLSWVDLDQSSRLWWADFDLLAVDVTVTGGDSLDWDYPTGEIYLALDGGHYIPPLEDSTDLDMLAELGVKGITTYDLLWQDPLEGNLLFYVPKGFDSAVLCLEERTGKDETERVAAIHTYAVTLPPREEVAP